MYEAQVRKSPVTDAAEAAAPAAMKGGARAQLAGKSYAEQAAALSPTSRNAPAATPAPQNAPVQLKKKKKKKKKQQQRRPQTNQRPQQNQDPVKATTPVEEPKLEEPKVEEPVELEDPALREKHRDGSVEYQRYTGDLFVNGVSPEDVIQGSIADCYLIAALCAVASSNPDLITSGVKPAGVGAWEVRFFERQANRTFKEVWIKVDADLPTLKGRTAPAYARSGDKNDKGLELWPAVFEKAYAVWKQGYDKMGEGGSSKGALEALTGKSVDTMTTEWTPADTIWAKLEKASKDGKLGKAASAGTHGKDRQDLYEGKRLYAWHAYTVMGIESAGGERFVILRNPWGQSEPGADGKDDGIFKLTLEEFMKYYQNLNLEL